MELNLEDWEEFYLGDVFKTNIAKSLDFGNAEKGSNIFIGRTSDNNGVQGYVSEQPVENGNCIIIGMVGENWAFYQSKPFVASQNIFVLRTEHLNEINAMFLCSVLNKCVEIYRKTYALPLGKEKMNKRILRLPIQRNSDKTPIIDKTFKYSKSGYVPDWQFMEDYIKSLHYKPITTSVKASNVKELGVNNWEEFKVSDLFNVKYGINMELNTCIETTSDDPEGIAFVARTAEHNGVSAYVKSIEGKEPQPAEIITVAGGGSVLSTFVQKRPFYSGRDLYLLIEKEDINLKVKMFISTVLFANQYRYSYGRQANKTLPDLILKLPIKRDNNGNPIIDDKHTYSDKGYIPDWEFMEDYINSLPYSDRI